ncbi:kinase-like domain-containing protein [Aspergillus carlsbadensis]|nr:kinase-like domain-containing protein [Aspergillus carlsbadensis]
MCNHAPLAPTIPEDEDFGDFVEDEDEAEDLEEVTEPWENYETEGNKNIYYPICIGEVLNGRYLIEHKLGFGGGSTVLMAHDLREEKDVALKVMSSWPWAENEVRMQREIAELVKDPSRLVTVLASFTLPVPASAPATAGGVEHHQVLVLPLMGPRINWHTLVKVSMATRMSAAWQLLEALESLHAAGIVHRDVSEGNCMWGTTSLAHLPRRAKYTELTRPLREKIPHVQSAYKTGELVRAANAPNHLRTDAFHLGDFGLAKKLTDPETQRGYPDLKFCSPERLHSHEPSTACDVWSYMVVFSILYLDFPLFTTIGGSVIGDDVLCLGPLPAEWRWSYTHPGGRDSWYDQSAEPDPRHDLASKVALRRSHADPAERAHVVAIMAKVFVYDPAKRPTAAELLADPDFRAIMDRYGC